MATRWVEPNRHTAEPLVRRWGGRQAVIISGADGCGKSRALQELARSDPSESRTPYATSPPRSDEWKTIALTRVQVEHWEDVWHRVVLVTVATHHLEEDAAEPGQIANLKNALVELELKMPALPYRDHPFAVLKLMAGKLAGAQDAEKRRWITSDKWRALERCLRDIGGAARQLAISIDDLDTYTDNDPSVLAEVEAGLAMFISAYSNNPLPCVSVRACVRGRVTRFLDIYTRTRIDESPAYCEVSWNKSDLRELLWSELEDLIGTRHDDLSEIVDSVSIHIPIRNSAEDAVEYLLRHGSLTPRDLKSLVLGLTGQREFLGRPLSQDEFRTVVAQLAVHLARGRAIQAITELRALGWRSVDTRNAVDSGASDSGALLDALLEAIDRLGRELFSRTSFLRHVVENWDEATRQYVTDVLWSNRLITLVAGQNGSRLVSRTMFDGIHRSDQTLAFNPILFDLRPFRLYKGGVHFEYR